MVYRFTVEHTYGTSGGPGINVFHARLEPAGDEAELISNMSTRLRAFYEAVKGLFPTQSSFRIREQVLNLDNQEVLPAPLWTVTGTSTSTAGYLPVAAAICLNWRSSNVSRSGRGRTFLGPLSTGTKDTDGTPTLAALTTITTAGQTFADSWDGLGDGHAVIWSPTDGVGRDILSAYARDQYAVLRSRRD